ncbi:GNAT family N-acetyltransferase [Dyella telluris]|uniref:GNAT family N-acetyltransferase n=1 Tax=Dyella telluris TaxID=2763498 RepID=A0A7G8Q5R8_9GAMM|nr:GNAT family N-acetyltransferase [Dyella telluris]QNK02126.1 GNAT family N-acetyltransferase [Dyella telluris]
MQHDDFDLGTSLRILALRDGRIVHVRTIQSQDKDILDDAFQKLGSESRYSRFFGTVREVPDDILQPEAPGPHGHVVALVALSNAGAGDIMVGGARYVTSPSGENCEFAVTVADDWRGLGLARQLMQQLINTAREREVRQMEGTVLATNTGMRGLAKRLGFKDGPYPGDYSLRLVTLEL